MNRPGVSGHFVSELPTGWWDRCSTVVRGLQFRWWKSPRCSYCLWWFGPMTHGAVGVFYLLDGATVSRDLINSVFVEAVDRLCP